MSEGLDELVEMARTIRMTPELAERQRRGFAYGNTQGPSTPLGMTGHRTSLTGRRSDWRKRSERAE
jgi:hypothetical protein